VREQLLLCVDDEINGLQLRKIILEAKGYRVLIAPSGAEGLRLFEENPVELVVLDFLMPEMKGDEVADRMRLLKPQVPIIMLSAYYDLPARVDLLVDARIVKGESTQNLLDTVARLLELQSSAAGRE
jgi:CheY-like chemotaxis protein